MAPKNKERPIPDGWTQETGVKKNGSRVTFYYCSDTDQQFDTYPDLMRYVRYAKRKGFSIYDQICKPVKKKRSLEKVSNSTKSEKQPAMSTRSTRRNPSSKPNSSTDELSLGSKSSNSSQSTDSYKDPSYLPESD